MIVNPIKNIFWLLLYLNFHNLSNRFEFRFEIIFSWIASDFGSKTTENPLNILFLFLYARDAWVGEAGIIFYKKFPLHDSEKIRY